MKKVVSIIIVSLSIIGVFGFALWEFAIKPSMEFYCLYGVLGVIGWFVFLTVVGFSFYGFTKLFNWATSNL